MRITDGNRQSITDLYIALSDAEAAELITVLTNMREAADGFHEHVTNSDYSVQITVYREDDETAIF